MTEITPPHLRCSYGGCPSVHLVEETGYAGCAVGASCPSITSHGLDVIIVGKIAAGLATQVARADGRLLSETIGPDETAVIVTQELLSDLPEMVRLRERVKELEGKSADADRALVNQAPTGLGPSGFDHFCEAEQIQYYRSRVESLQRDYFIFGQALETLQKIANGDELGGSVHRDMARDALDIIHQATWPADDLRESDTRPKDEDPSGASLASSTVPAGNSPDLNAHSASQTPEEGSPATGRP
jgi:hypothetical protein